MTYGTVPKKVWNILKKDKSFMKKVNTTRKKVGLKPLKVKKQ